MKTLLTIVILLLSISIPSFAQSADYLKQYKQAMASKNYENAIYAMDNVLKNKEQRTSELYYNRALAYSKKGDMVFTIADCTSALALDPNNTKAYFLRGKSKLLMGDPTYAKDLQQGGEEGLALLQQNPGKTPQKQGRNYVAVTSDVDVNIPTTSVNSNKNTFALIFSNEKYDEPNISDVNFAKKDGSVFREYCLNVLGIPKDNIHMKENATRNQMRSEVKWIQNIADAFGKDANIILFYSGHGMPDEHSKKAYILPSDGIANDPESAYALSSLYAQLGSLDVNSVVVFLDACFSGSKRDGGMLTASKGVAIKPKEESLNGNLIVISASQGDETAYPYDEKGHGLFTYFLLKKLQETEGRTTLYDLGQYIINNVRQTAIVKNSKPQTPTITVASGIESKWRTLQFK